LPSDLAVHSVRAAANRTSPPAKQLHLVPERSAANDALYCNLAVHDGDERSVYHSPANEAALERRAKYKRGHRANLPASSTCLWCLYKIYDVFLDLTMRSLAGLHGDQQRYVPHGLFKERLTLIGLRLLLQ